MKRFIKKLKIGDVDVEVEIISKTELDPESLEIRPSNRIYGRFHRWHILPPSKTGENLGFSFHGFTNNEGLLPLEKLDQAGYYLAIQLEKFLNDEL